MASTTTISAFALIVLAITTLLAGIGNNVFFVTMGQAFQGYPQVCYFLFIFLWISVAYLHHCHTIWYSPTPPVPHRNRRRQFLNWFQCLLSTIFFFAVMWVQDSGLYSRLARGARRSCGARWQPPSSAANEATPIMAAMVTKEAAVRPPMPFWHYAGIGVCIWANGMLSQTTDPFVDGDWQAVLSVASLPLTGIIAMIWIRTRFSVGQLVGTCVVLGGISISIVPPMLDGHRATGNGAHTSGTTNATGLEEVAAVATTAAPTAVPSTTHMPAYDTFLPVLMFALSTAPQALQNVWQQKIYTPQYHGRVVESMAYANLVALPLYVVSLLPYSWLMTDDSVGAYLAHQYDAVLCFAGRLPASESCQAGAAWQLIWFVVVYGVFFLATGALVQRAGAMLKALLVVLVTPLAAILFSFKALVGPASYAPLSIWTILAVLVIPVGCVIYEVSSRHGAARAPGRDVEAGTAAGYASVVDPRTRSNASELAATINGGESPVLSL